MGNIFQYQTILDRMLARIPNSLDKRQGSIIYDALAPCAAEIAQIAIEIEIYYTETYLMTASNVNLDNRAYDFGYERYPAVTAIATGIIEDRQGNNINVPIGSRFSRPNSTPMISYVVTDIQSGLVTFECEIAGLIGNEYVGEVLPLFSQSIIGRAEIIEIIRPGNNTEDDDTFRQRVIDGLRRKAFGGNIAHYIQWTRAIPGVGDVKVFPIWNGGGTVLLSIVDGEYNPVSPQFVETVKNELDPPYQEGMGFGTAPIGHVVTVVTPNILDVQISCKLTMKEYTVSQMQVPVEDVLQEYFKTLRKEWARFDSVSIIISQIIAAILTIRSIADVTNVKINGLPSNLILNQTATSQILPYLTSVVLT